MAPNLLLMLVLVSANPAEDLNCFPKDAQTAPADIFYHSLQQACYQALDKRVANYDQIKTEADARAYQQKLREFFVTQLGGFPERTPVNGQVVGQIAAEGYRLEKVIFESLPQHHVTATLYLPAGAGPHPAVLIASGHTRSAKAADYNQKLAMALALNGLAALCYDPIGQGERSQILTPSGTPQFESTVNEHFLIGVGSILVGTNTARHEIWDGMRAVDYLASRKDIDARRIGMAGCSGGGTQTSYAMALDPRVVCAAPSCYLSTFQKLIESMGPQDAEQNIFGQIAFGLDQPDYVLLHAPQPTLISSTTGDYFDIRGAWENFRQAKRVYGLFGYPERVDLVEADGKHGIQPINRLAMVRWMRRWLLGKDDAVTLVEQEIRTEAELLCTKRGQVLLLPEERSVFDLNAEQAQRLAQQRKAFWEKTKPAEALQKVRSVAGIRPLKELPAPKEEDLGRVQREGYHIDKLLLHTGSGVALPALTFHPPQPREDAYLYLHQDGKLADGAVEGPIENLVQEGFVVVAIDLRGLGEMAQAKPDPLLGDWKNFYTAYLLGKSLVGLHTEDTLSAGQFIANYKTKTPRKVHLIGVGRAGIPALHAAALEPELFASLTLRDTLESWASLVSQPIPAGQLPSTIHGVLGVYDLPDLLKSIPAEKVTLEKSK